MCANEPWLRFFLRDASEQGLQPEVLPAQFFDKALSDERRHRDWMQRTSETI
jgi:hypothetical protein